MKISIDQNGEFLLEDLFIGIGIKTDAGIFAICQRDGGISIKLGKGSWYDWRDLALNYKSQRTGMCEALIDELANMLPYAQEEDFNKIESEITTLLQKQREKRKNATSR